MDQCLELNPNDLSDLCVHLSQRIDSLKTQPVVTAIIAALAAVLGAFLSTRGTLLSSRTERKNKSQREALHGAQDAAQALRTKLTSLKGWSDGGEEGDSPLLRHEEQDLVAALEKFVSRVADTEVKDKFNTWRDWARLYFHDSDEHDIHGERDRWRDAINSAGDSALALD